VEGKERDIQKERKGGRPREKRERKTGEKKEGRRGRGRKMKNEKQEKERKERERGNVENNKDSPKSQLTSTFPRINGDIQIETCQSCYRTTSEHCKM
jgi:hypothetical protein